jgi:hypothetical protein
MTDLIFDASSLYARAWYAGKQSPKLCLEIAVKMVLQLLDRDAGGSGRVVNRTLFAWDGHAKTDKKRAPKPPGYVETRYRFQEALLTLFDTVHGFHPDFEADDIVATAVFNSKADEIIVVSGDKDLMQLQGGNVMYYDLNTKQIMNPRRICAKFSVKQPTQIPLALAIIGDPGDNISGIPRWGPKKAARIFEMVTDKMNFGEALAAVQRQIPDHFMPVFMESLDKTLLFTDVASVPEPVPLAFCSFEDMKSLRIDGIAQAYERIAAQYEDRRADLTSMIRGSGSGLPRQIGD